MHKNLEKIVFCGRRKLNLISIELEYFVDLECSELSGVGKITKYNKYSVNTYCVRIVQ